MSAGSGYVSAASTSPEPSAPPAGAAASSLEQPDHAETVQPELASQTENRMEAECALANEPELSAEAPSEASKLHSKERDDLQVNPQIEEEADMVPDEGQTDCAADAIKTAAAGRSDVSAGCSTNCPHHDDSTGTPASHEVCPPDAASEEAASCPTELLPADKEPKGSVALAKPEALGLVLD